MTTSITVNRKRGRPATGRDPAISVRVPQAIIDQIDNERGDHSRSDFVREVLEQRFDASRVE
jgi:hypothetical protein